MHDYRKSAAILPETTSRPFGRAARLLAVALLAVAATAADAPNDQAEDTGEERFVVVKAKRVITNTGKPIPNGVIVIVNGKIRNVGAGLEYPGNARVIDARDRVVMPGLICPQTRFGLPAYSRNGVHGNWTVADEYFPRENTFEALLDAGYTAVALIPDGFGIPGRALVVRTGGPLDQRMLKSPAFVAVTGDKKTLREGLERAEKEIEKVTKAREKFDEEQKKAQAAPQPPASQPPTTQPATAASAPASAPVFKPPPIDPAHEVLVDLIQKKEGLEAQISLRRASDWVHVADLLKRFEIAHHFVISNSWNSDVYRVAREMGEKKARVALWPLVNRIPFSNERVNTARELSEAGCEVSLMPPGDSPAEFSLMRQRTSQLVAAGWKRAEALKALTLNPAKLLGLGERLGTIEKGRDADLIFLTGDPLAPESRIREVMIGGEIVHRVQESN